MQYGSIRSYRDLIVWQKSVELVVSTYHTIDDSRIKERWGLDFQIKKSIVSVPSNIAEGYGREGIKDYIRFLNMGLGSLFEFQTQLLIAERLGLIRNESFEECYAKSREVERMLSKQIRVLKQKISRQNKS